MGIIDNLRNKVNQRNEQTQTTQQAYSNNVQDIFREDGKQLKFIIDRDIPFYFKHRNGEETKLIKARVMIFEPGNAIIQGAGTPICFEIPKDMGVQDVFDIGFFNALDKAGYFDNLEENRYNVLGKIVMENNQERLEQCSDTVYRNVETLNQQMVYEKQMKQQEFQRNQEQKQIEQMRQQELQRIQEQNILDQRKQNVQFVIENEGLNNELQKYKTVDQTTGEIIRLVQVRKIGKDDESNYLYTAKIQKQRMDNMGGMHLKDNEGSSVVFSTAYKLDDIAIMQDPELVKRISLLLSGNDLQDKKMTYIGQLRHDGEISKNLYETSQAIQNNVRKLQEEFAKSQSNDDIRR